MKRLTSDNVFEMNMTQLALNQVYIKDGWAQYRNAPEDELSVCDLIRSAAETLAVKLPVLGDDELSSLLSDWLWYGAEESEGVLAILYRALWAMAEVRARLKQYEDTCLEPEEVLEYQHLCTSFVEAGLDAKFIQVCIDAVNSGVTVECLHEITRLPQSNAPLLPEELREMDGDKIYIHYINGFYTDEDGAYFGKFEQLVREFNGRLTACDLPLEYYGRTWLAYRRNLEESIG